VGRRVQGLTVVYLASQTSYSLQYPAPARARKIPLRANRTQPPPLAPASKAAPTTNRGWSSGGLVVTTSNGRSALQYAKYACLHPAPETRSLPDVGCRDKRARSRQSSPPSLPVHSSSLASERASDGSMFAAGDFFSFEPEVQFNVAFLDSERADDTSRTKQSR